MAEQPGIEALVGTIGQAAHPAIVADAEDRILEVNPPAESLFGYGRTELVGRPLHELVPTLPPVPTLGSAVTVDARHRDGHRLRLTVSFRAVPAETGPVTATFFRPVETPADPAAPILDRIPVPIFRFGAEARLEYANLAAHGILGGRSERYLGRRPTEFHLPAPAARTWDEAVQDALAMGATRRFGLSLELGGGARWFAGTALPETGPAGGRGVLVLIQDVTALHRSRADFETAELRFRRLTDGSHDLISQHGQDGAFLFASRAATTMLDRSPESLVGTRFTDLVLEEDRGIVATAISGALAGEAERLTTFRLMKPDGSFIWCEMTAHAAGAGSRAITCITRDITERLRTEEVLRAASRMEATATLAAGVAHDFNNLMTSILGNAELLLSDPSFPDASSRLHQVADAANRGGALAQQLLAYARGGKYQAERVSVNEIVTQALHLQKHAMPPRIQLEIDLDPDSPAVEADPVQIGQVVTNLCINATEATPGVGRVTVRTRGTNLTEAEVTGRPGLKPGRAVLIEVADSGTGIEPAVVKRIFEPFFSTKFQGRGLGLAAAYGIVKNHRGYIGVDSALGRGTTFSIYLPAIEAVPAKPAVPAEPFPTGQETILLVDDDPAVIDVTRSILERLKYQVLVAHHGIEAVEVARTHEGAIDLAILDLGMPLAGGAEAFPFLKAVRPDMRVMISSGYEMNEVVQGLLGAGADAFLQKPYRVSALARGIRQVLEGRATGGRLGT
ncbi:MAG: PAS domain-containing protein [Gemmatimonadales bacterium]